MRTVLRHFVVGACAVLLSAGVAAANGEQAGSDSTTKQPRIDDQAIEALRNMGTFLREQENFTVSTRADTDYVTDTGQKLTVSSHGSIQAHRPDRLRAEIVSDRKHRQYFYDGKKFTIYSPVLGLYASVDAPPTIGELAGQLEEQYGLELPLVDLFRWGDENPDFSDIESATYVGPAKIDGVDVNHYAFRQAGVDWQLWIEAGDTPVPRKLLITTTDDPARPEYMVDMSWKLGAKHADTMFTFVPPKGSGQIALRAAPPPPEIEDTRSAKRTPRREKR